MSSWTPAPRPSPPSSSSSSSPPSSHNAPLSSSPPNAQYVDYEHQQPTSGTATPHPREDARLLSTPSSPVTNMSPDFVPPTQRPMRTGSTGSFVSSPLKPGGGVASPNVSPFAAPFNPRMSISSRPASRTSTNAHLLPHSKFPTDDFGLPPSLPGSIGGTRGSMILYRLADDPATQRESLLPPRFSSFHAGARDSVVSSSGSSFISLNSDSKYPSGMPTQRGLVPYVYDPALDELDPPDEEDMLHDPSEKAGFKGDKGHFPWRGLLNVGVLLLLILGLLCLFVFYPVMTFYRDQARNNRIDGNIRINATGQAPVLFQMPEMIDSETPDSAKTRTGFDGNDYELVFSDEFNTDGRTFWPGDDPFWEAVDLWYGATGDLEWYDPQQVTTRDGALVITMDSTSTTQAGLTPGSTAPFTAAENHLLDYRSGMLQSWNKFCFTTGYIEVAVTFPGPNEDTQGYWPGAWTMGNLARPGYSATTDGMWPYTYDSCDVGTLPNQTNVDGLGPPAALHSDFSRDKYNNELSWLSGQRLSACSCPGGDHPGPGTKGRGAPEIDIFEASKDKQNPHGQTVSQSAQFAPFTHDYIYLNATTDEWQIFDPDRTRPNTYHGSAVQQSVSGVVKTPSDMFQGSGTNFKTFGFEYFADPNNREDGYIMWQVDGQPSHRVWAKAVGPDQGPDGSGVGQRLIPEEPMSIVLNLGISESWQTIDLSTMSFPSEMKFDYVRVYQRKGSVNTGCNPPDYPTEDYIKNHLSAYQDVNKTKWDWEIPRNSMVTPC